MYLYLRVGGSFTVRLGRQRLALPAVAARALMSPSGAPALPPELLPALLELERSPPLDPAAYFGAVLDSSANASSSSTAAAEVFRFAASHGLQAEELQHRLQAAGLGQAAAAMFADAWSAQRSDATALVRPPPLRLVDADWSFGVSASSSEHAALGTTFVHVRLRTRTEIGGLETVHMELNLARFYELLISLEAAKARCDLV